MPEEYGGSGLGISEAALMMHTISSTGAGLSGASAVHMNIFGLHPVVVFGTDEQRRRWLPPLIQGPDRWRSWPSGPAVMPVGAGWAFVVPDG
jgi:acyl-CoA dehydrogenase